MSNTYQLMDNPLLTSGGLASESEIRSRAAPIYTRLSAYKPFAPITATAVSDWSIQAGDIIRVATGDGDRLLPVYTQKIEWNGGAKSVYQSTGSEKRPVQNIQARTQNNTNRAIGSMRSSVGALGNRTSKLEKDVNYAYIQIDEANALIELEAGRLDELGNRVSYAEIEIDGANAQISLKAGQEQVDELGNRVTQAEIDIDGANSEIRLKANKVYVDAQITEVKKLIADEIDAAIAEIDLSMSETVVTQYLTVTGRATLKALALDGTNVSKTTLPVVTSFSQASGEQAPTRDVTFLTTAVGVETTHEVALGETKTFAA